MTKAQKLTPLILLILIIWGTSIGCRSLKIDKLPASGTIDPQPLKLEPAIDGFFMRADVVRQTYQVTSTNAQGHTTTTTRPVPYHPIGLKIGNSLFIDANQNISLLIPDYYKFSDFDFTLIRRGSGLFSSDYTYTKKGQKLHISGSGIFGKELDVSFSPKGVTFVGGVFDTTNEAVFEGADLRMKASGIFDRDTVLKKTQVGYTIPGFWDDKEFRQDKDGIIRIEDNVIISRKEQWVEIKTIGWFSDSLYRCAFQTEQVVCINEDKNGFWIKREADGFRGEVHTVGLGLWEINYSLKAGPNHLNPNFM